MKGMDVTIPKAQADKTCGIPNPLLPTMVYRISTVMVQLGF